jgi:hypothetical protein
MLIFSFFLPRLSPHWPLPPPPVGRRGRTCGTGSAAGARRGASRRWLLRGMQRLHASSSRKKHKKRLQ